MSDVHGHEIIGYLVIDAFKDLVKGLVGLQEAVVVSEVKLTRRQLF